MAGEFDLNIGDLLRKKYALKQEEANAKSQDASTRAEALALRRSAMANRSSGEEGADRRDLERDAGIGVLAAKSAHQLSYEERKALDRQKTIDETRRAAEAARSQEQGRAREAERTRTEHDAAKKANPYAFWREDADRLDSIANDWNQDSKTRSAALEARNNLYFNSDANDAMARRIAQAGDPGTQIRAKDSAQADARRQELEDRIAKGAEVDPSMQKFIEDTTRQRAEEALGQLGYQKRDSGTDKERWAMTPPLPKGMGGSRPVAGGQGAESGQPQSEVGSGRTPASSTSPGLPEGASPPRPAGGGPVQGGEGWLRDDAAPGRGVSPDGIEWRNAPQGQQVAGRGTPDDSFRYAPASSPPAPAPSVPSGQLGFGPGAAGQTGTPGAGNTWRPGTAGVASASPEMPSPAGDSEQRPATGGYTPSEALGDAVRGNAVNKEAMRKTLTDIYGNVGGTVVNGAANAITGAVDVARNAPSAIWNAIKPGGVEQAQANMQWAVNRPVPTGAEAEPAQWVRDAAPEVVDIGAKAMNPMGTIGGMLWRKAGKALEPVADKVGEVASQIGRNASRAIQGQPTYTEEGAGAGMNWRGEDEEARKRRVAG